MTMYKSSFALLSLQKRAEKGDAGNIVRGRTRTKLDTGVEEHPSPKLMALSREGGREGVRKEKCYKNLSIRG